MFHFAIPRAVVFLLPPLLLSSLAAQERIKLEPLPEMIAAEGYESVGRDRRMTYEASAKEKDPKTGKPKYTAISYGEHKFLKATLEGKTVYLHRYWEEAPRLDLGRFEIRTSYTLYDENLQFIVQRTMQQVGDETHTQELRWRDGKLIRTAEGKRKETALAVKNRPQSLFGLMMLQGSDNREKRTVHVLIGDKVEAVEMLMSGMNRGAKGTIAGYSTTGAIQGKWWVSTTGEGLSQARLEKPAIAIDQAKVSRAQCGLALDRKRLCADYFLTRAHKASRGKKTKWKNKLVGMALRLPSRNWKQDDQATRQRIFSAVTKKNEAVLRVSAWFVPSCVDFEGLVEARILSERPKAVERKIDREDVEIAGRESIRLSYKVVSQDHERRETSYYFQGKGCILELYFGYWLGFDYEPEKDLAYILKHLKFDK